MDIRRLKRTNYSKKKKGINVFYYLRKYKRRRYRCSFHDVIYTTLGVDSFSQCINIKVTANNIFANFRDLLLNQTLLARSASKYQIKTTRKKLRYTIKYFLRAFFQEVLAKFTLELLVIHIEAPVRIRRIIVFYLREVLKDKLKKLIVKVSPGKCFNGCRPAKKRRKKRKGLRIFK